MRFLGVLCASVAFISFHEAAPRIQLESPLDYQVFQRKISPQDPRGHGVVQVHGRVLESPAKRVELRIGAIVTTAPVDPKTRVFDASITVPAGGFYALEARIPGNRDVAAHVAHVGVGEVFVVAGQSNATNYGEERTQTKSRMVSAFDGQSWRIADDPQPGVPDNSQKGSFVPSFGDALYEKIGVPIGVASAGHGSTSVRQWLMKGSRVAVMPTMTKFIATREDGTLECDGRLFDGLIERILGLGAFRAVLWHQGESDARQQPGHEISGPEYRAAMEQIIRESHRRAGDFPWFVAQASYHNPRDTGSEEIREAQRSLWESGLALRGPDTDTLTGPYRQNGGQGVHMSAAGLAAHGKMWADVVGAYLDSLK